MPDSCVPAELDVGCDGNNDDDHDDMSSSISEDPSHKDRSTLRSMLRSSVKGQVMCSRAPWAIVLCSSVKGQVMCSRAPWAIVLWSLTNGQVMCSRAPWAIVLRSLVWSCDLEKRDPLGCEIETGPFRRYDPTDNPQNATSTSNTNYNVTNSCSLLFLLFFVVEPPNKILLLHWTLSLFRH